MRRGRRRTRAAEGDEDAEGEDGVAGKVDSVGREKKRDILNCFFQVGGPVGFHVLEGCDGEIGEADDTAEEVEKDEEPEGEG
jgi:hypothetical protein